MKADRASFARFQHTEELLSVPPQYLREMSRWFWKVSRENQCVSLGSSSL